MKDQEKIEYICKGFDFPAKNMVIIDPFAGNGILINKFTNEYKCECYDIEPTKEEIQKRDIFLDPPDYNNKYVITQPPVLALNMTKKKEIFKQYDTDNLYKCFLKQLIMTQNLIGGILILPLNFWCSTRNIDIKLRQGFLSIYNIIKLNIFEEIIFENLSHTICSFQFISKTIEKSIPIEIFPIGSKLCIDLNEDNNYTFGGEIFNLPQNKDYVVSRLYKNGTPSTNILVKCIDDNKDNMICMKLVSDSELVYDNSDTKSERGYATLVITPSITMDQQKQLILEFNQYINEQRDKYNSLFLLNFRESSLMARKRISFELVYSIVGFLLIKF
jgi:hypothetical protein